MLEHCTSLNECEKILSASLDEILYLGEVDFSLEDIEKLSILIKEKINQEEGIKLLIGIPACVSFYLVGKGIIHYRGGEFWSPIINELGITDATKQYMLGSIFLKLIKSRGLSYLHIRGAHAYVTPILLHGGIPLSCFREFYDKVVTVYLNQRIVEEHHLRQEIYRVREKANIRSELLENIRNIDKRIKNLNQDIVNLDNIITLYRLREELQEKTAGWGEWSYLPDYDQYIENAELQRLNISQRIEQLTKEKVKYQEKINSFTINDKKLLDFKEEVKQLAQEFGFYQDANETIIILETKVNDLLGAFNTLAMEIWQWERGQQFGEAFQSSGECQKIISHLRNFLAFELAKLSNNSVSLIPQDVEKFVELLQEQPTLHPLVASGEAWIGGFKALQTACREYFRYKQELAQLKQETAEWKSTLVQVAAALHTPLTGSLEQTIRELNELVIQAVLKKIKSDTAREVLQIDVLPALRLAECRRDKIEQEIAALQFLAFKKQELNEIEQEIKRLKEKEAELLTQVELYTPTDFKMLELAEIIQKLVQDLALYQELQKRWELLSSEVDKYVEKIKSMASELWPGGWNEKYISIIYGMDIIGVSQELDRLIQINSLFTQTNETLDQMVIKVARPSLVLWIGGILAPIGTGLALTTQNSTGYLVLLADLLLLVVGYYHFKRGKGHQVKQEEYRESLKQELLRIKSNLDSSAGKLLELLDGLPVCLESLIALGQAWVDRFKTLQAVYREYQRCEQELTQIEQEMEEWESGLEQVAAALSNPIIGPLEQVIVELVERQIQAEARKRNADAAMEMLEQEIIPAVVLAESCRNQVEQEIAAGVQRFDALGEIDPPKSLDDALELEQKLGLSALADLPEYYRFIAARQNEISEIDREISKLKEKEAECLEYINSYTTFHQKALDLAGVINKIIYEYHFYDERKKRQQLVKSELKKQTGEIESLILELWPDKCSDICDVTTVELVASEQLNQILDLWLENIKKLQVIHSEYRRNTDELIKFRKKTRDWENKFTKVATALSFSITKSFETAIAELINQTKLAVEREKSAEKAKVAEREIYSKLQEAISNLEQINREVSEVKQKIKELGKGDLEKGNKVLKEKKQALIELEQINKKIEQYTALFPQVHKNWHNYLLLKEEKNIELNILKVKLFELEEQLENYTSPFDYTDEPVQRFLIYGGEWAIKWLYACIALHRHYLGENIDLDSTTASLPIRVIEKLEEIVRTIFDERKRDSERIRQGQKRERTEDNKLIKEKENKNDSKEAIIQEHFTNPEVKLDVSKGDLKMVIGGHRFHIYDPTSPPEILVRIVSGEMPPVWVKEMCLGGYLKEDMVEIPKDYIDLPHVSSEYLVTQYIGGITHCWRVKACDDKPYMVFNEKGKKIDSNGLAEQRVWLFFPKKFKLYPENAIVLGKEVFFDGDMYKLVLVNFLLEPLILLTSQQNQECTYVIESSFSELPTKPYLSNEEATIGVWAEGKRIIYTEIVPRLFIPLNNIDDIKDWKISIIKKISGGINKNLTYAKEVLDLGLLNKDNCFEIQMNSEELLGPHPLGEYSITLDRQGQVEHWLDLVIFPDLMLFFEPEVYFPQKLEGSEARLTIVVPENYQDVLEVDVKKPARVVERDGDEVHIAIELEHNEINAELIYISEGEQCCTSITVEIPKIRWRINGSNETELKEWTQYIKEVWHKACININNPCLEVEVPQQLNNVIERFKVYLEDIDQLVAGKSNGMLQRFDLSGLADALRGGRETCSLNLALENARGNVVAEGKLFDIRCTWKVDNFQYNVEESLGKWIIKATWVDRGEEMDRVALLWRLWEPWVKPMVFSIPDGRSEIEICVNTSELPPGPYLLKFDVDDQWGSEELLNEFPNKEYNTEQIIVGNARTSIIVSECNWIKDRILRVSGKLVNVSGKKEILVKLLGIIKGEYKEWSEKVYTDGGHFSFEIESPSIQFTPETSRVYAGKKEIIRPHWLGIIVRDSDPIYHFQVLPEPGGLWFPLALGAALTEQNKIQWSQIYIDCFDERLDEPLLSCEISKKIISLFQQGNGIIEIKIQVAGKSKKAKLCKASNENEVKIELETRAIKCTTCGKIELDHESWRKNHQKCKSFLVNFQEINATL